MKASRYELDDCGCLKDFNLWDEEFVYCMKGSVNIGEITERHMKIIKYIREYVKENGKSPVVYHVCRENGIKLRELERLFPEGYHRAACLLAGLNYYGIYQKVSDEVDKVYRINKFGYLVDYNEWDVDFAKLRAEEGGIELSTAHLRVIYFIRDGYKKNGKIPTVFETCNYMNFEAEELEKLFPNGYHRGAVKLAGLKL